MKDKNLIASLGGVTAVAKKLGYAPSRVGNWVSRGIPPKVRLEHVSLFGLPEKRRGRKSA